MQIRCKGHFLILIWRSGDESSWIHTLLIDWLHPLRSRHLLLG